MYLLKTIFCLLFILSFYLIQNVELYNYREEINTEEIPIGLFVDRNAAEMSIAFNTAIEVANANMENQLTPILEEVDFGDSFNAFGKLSKMIKTGISGVFGPNSRETAAHLATFCDSKDVPYVYSHLFSYADGFNLYPSPADIAAALNCTIRAFDWSRFVLLYESSEYLNIINEFMTIYGNNRSYILVQRYDTNIDGNYKTVLRRIRKSVDNQIVVLGSTDTMQEFLRQAQQVGIITKVYKFIIANLDFHTLDLSDYKFGEANITSFRMFSTFQPEVHDLILKLDPAYENVDFRNGSCPITMEMALTYDAVQLFAEATKYLTLRPTTSNCSQNRDCVLDGGTSFKNYMRSMDIIDKTITGRIYFEENVRKGYQFDVVELQPSGIIEVGTWNENDGFVTKRLAQTNALLDKVDYSFSNKTFKILLSLTKPYASLIESQKPLSGNDQFEGYCVELVKELADKLGFNFTLIDGGTDYGLFNRTTNTSTGMMKKILDGEADLIFTDATITAERQQVMDFTIPFMNLGIAILYLKPQVEKPSLFSFMAPLSIDVWVYLGLSFLATSLSFFILGRLSPVEWDNPYPCVEEPTELENQFTIGNSLWFTTGALLQQGSEIGPKSVSTRAVASIWWFFTLIMVNSYTANLAAFLTVTIPTTVINSVDDLAQHKEDVVFGAKKSGATRNFFLNSEVETYKRMNEYMVQHPEYLTENNEEGVRRVKESKKYAFLMESTTIDYNTMRECNLKKIGEPLDEKGYGIAMRKDWPYRSKFNEALLQLQEQGDLEKMKNKWWNEVGAGICTSKGEQSEASELNMENLGGVYFVLVVGSTLALLYGIINWMLFVMDNAVRFNMSMKEAFAQEFKFLINIHAHTREY